MIVLSLVVIGAASYFQLDIDKHPEVELPTVSIRTNLPGASPEEVEVSITQVIEEADAYRFAGDVPWVTGAAHADFLVTGGTLADGRQILAAISAKLPGVGIGEPARLLALSASHTSPVRLENVLVEKKFVVAGPVEQVMRQGASSTGSLGTSALAAGLSLAALRHLAAEAAVRPDLLPIVQPLMDECRSLEADLAQAAGRSSSGSFQS